MSKSKAWVIVKLKWAKKNSQIRHGKVDIVKKKLLNQTLQNIKLLIKTTLRRK